MARKKTTKRVALKRRKRAMKPRVKRLRYSQALLPEFKTALSYNETGYKTITITDPTLSLVWRLNDIHDPFYSGTGHQAKYSDQYYQLYQYARCVGFSITVKIFTDSLNPIQAIAGPYNDYYVISHEAFAEDRKVAKRLVTSNFTARFSYKNYTDRHLRNRRGTVTTDDTFKQTRGTGLGTAQSCWYHIMTKAIAQTSALSQTLYYQVSLRQYIRFTGIIPVGLS